MEIKHCILISLIIMLLLMIPASFAAADDSIILNEKKQIQALIQMRIVLEVLMMRFLMKAIPRVKVTSTQTIQITSI